MYQTIKVEEKRIKISETKTLVHPAHYEIINTETGEFVKTGKGTNWVHTDKRIADQVAKLSNEKEK